MVWRYVLSFVLAPCLGAWEAPSTCIVVDGQNILARNLAAIYPAFFALEGDTTVSYAPAPGGRRTVAAAEISGWARSRGLTMQAQEGACFERAGFARTAKDYQEAIRTELRPSKATAEIEVLDFYSHILPPGRLELPTAGAALPPLEHPETAFIWRGHLITSDGVAYPVWARVRILETQIIVRAARDLPAGTILEARQLTSAPQMWNPLLAADSEPLSFYVGKSLRRSLSGGSPLYPRLVEVPPIIRRGDKVRVTVVNGSAHLELEASANGSGYLGDSVLLTNPAGSKNFRAIITGPGRAEIILNLFREQAKRGTAPAPLAGKGSS